MALSFAIIDTPYSNGPSISSVGCGECGLTSGVAELWATMLGSFASPADLCMRAANAMSAAAITTAAIIHVMMSTFLCFFFPVPEMPEIPEMPAASAFAPVPDAAFSPFSDAPAGASEWP